ncbi:MAG TPA: calcium/sodium antiporter [Thauera aminoaromatica]|jgi:cation:H+ antiporter|uniref:Calcium/sodium antiporter n=2 Tax=Thauera aminoaromatica TaxID=164330 RepID=C4KD19_THASP|nr:MULTISPECIES: calcium/sodium antiporter [Thauera]OPZ04353.1 MAG: Inner membrane protein YrbG [Alphaproteobacteria bacterium ADurb.BinA305]HNB44714.1 calcium/sodium antiporter [Burkholderiaceae bacterium]ACR02430.1 Na+/Ca+ antiporter, CaCA family [Thauera aminoaromatica]ENO84063.1 CaCA family Na+/Ca+ antiporter [Thauera aminoaromatica S2]KIN89282.1 sodium/calcium exchanger family protein [Thauera sp. SWB20]
MLQQVLMFALGLTVLVVGADVLVRGASRLAVSFGVSPLVVGLTVVAFGTSAPEMAVSVGSALAGSPDLALGNVVGSNICNVLLILGISALITPLLVDEQIIRQEIPIMIGVSALLVVMALDGHLGLVESIVLFALVIAYTVFLIVQSRRASKAVQEEFGTDLPTSAWDRHWAVQVGLIATGLVMLIVGADWLVEAAVAFARAFGVSDLVVGLTVVAVGTSMPEIATSIVAAMRGQRDIAVGNVVGSNIFNILAVLGASGIASGTGLPVSEAARNFDLWVMLAVAFACLPIMITGREIARWEGGVFLAYYAAYTAWLVLQAQQHTSLPAFSGIMLGYVMPLTVITVVVSIVRSNGRRA